MNCLPRAAAGDKDVRIAGGADTVQQSIGAGLLDEQQNLIDPKHIEVENTRVIDSPRVTHLRYHVVKED